MSRGLGHNRVVRLILRNGTQYVVDDSPQGKLRSSNQDALARGGTIECLDIKFVPDYPTLFEVLLFNRLVIAIPWHSIGVAVYDSDVAQEEEESRE
jgi:hypothetical protein